MIFGYLVSLGYILVLIAIFGIIHKKCNLNVEISRKILHILIGFTWVFMDLFWGCSYHQIIMCAIFLVLNALSLKFKFFSAIERTDNGKNHAGTVYYALAMLVLSVCSYIYKPLYIPFGMAVMCLSFGDGFAPIIAHVFKKFNLKLVGDKTLFGTIACVLFSFLALIVFNFAYKLDYSILSLLAASTLVGIVELFSKKGLDNFGISFLSALFLWGVQQNLFANTILLILVCLSALIVLLILLSKALTEGGALLAYVMLLVASYSAGYQGFLLYVIPFTLIAVVGAVAKLVLKKSNSAGLNSPNRPACTLGISDDSPNPGEDVEKCETMHSQGSPTTQAKTIPTPKSKPKHQRNWLQVLINGGAALVMLVIYKITANIGFFLLAGVSLAESFVDSVASDVGSLSKSQPVDIFRRKRVQKGVSGGITLLGTLSSLVASVIMGFVCFLLKVDWIIFAFVCGFSFLGMFIDSAFGSLLQALYLCPSCGALTESPIHCQTKATIIKGKAFVNNNFVNLVSNLTTLALACLWFLH